MVKLFERDRPPRHVMILGEKVKIKLVKELMMTDGHELVGAYNDSSKTIFLLKDKNWKKTLLHEICHCVLAISGAGSVLGTKAEEAVVTSIENGLAPLLF